jgi:putative membrane protein
MRGRASICQVALGVSVALMGLTAPAARAQDAGSRPTREFLQAVANSDQFEIAEAQTVLTQSTNPDVRAFATRMLQDHQQHAQAVVDAAARSGLKPPEMAMSADQAQWLGALQSVKGVDFDKLYVRQQMLAHSSALAVVQIYATAGDYPEVRQMATSTLPLLTAHGDMVNQLGSKLGSR